MKRTPLKRKPRRRAPVGLEALTWKRAVTRGGCVMCRQFPVPWTLRKDFLVELSTIEAHHIVAQRHLKREHLEGLLWDHANGIGLCHWHHHRHENAYQRIPRSVLPAPALAFAEEHGLGWVIDKEYR